MDIQPNQLELGYTCLTYQSCICSSGHITSFLRPYLPGLASLASQSILSLVLQIVASVYDMRMPPPHRPDSCLKFNMPIVNFAHNYKEGQGEKRKW